MPGKPDRRRRDDEGKDERLQRTKQKSLLRNGAEKFRDPCRELPEVAGERQPARAPSPRNHDRGDKKATPPNRAAPLRSLPERFRAKWIPVRVKKTRQNNKDR